MPPDPLALACLACWCCTYQGLSNQYQNLITLFIVCPINAWELATPLALLSLALVWQRISMAINLCAAHKKTGLHAAHEVWLMICSTYYVTHEFWMNHLTKLRNTCVFSAHKYQLVPYAKMFKQLQFKD